MHTELCQFNDSAREEMNSYLFFGVAACDDCLWKELLIKKNVNSEAQSTFKRKLVKEISTFKSILELFFRE